MLTVIRLGLPDQLRRSLGCTNAIESLMAVLRQICRNVKRWRDARMALRWTGPQCWKPSKSFPTVEGPQAAPGSEGRFAATSTSITWRSKHCQQKSGSVGFNRRRLLHQFQQATGLSGRRNPPRDTDFSSESTVTTQIILGMLSIPSSALAWVPPVLCSVPVGGRWPTPWRSLGFNRCR